jgi:CRP/FNR family transcriptional regulator, cyclic AMP receptor protein
MRRPNLMADQRDAGKLLAAIALFAGVPQDELDHVAASSRLRRFPRGQVVFSTGDPSESLLVTVSGRIKVVVRSADGGELMLAVVEPGGVIGELGVIDGGVRSAEAETLEATEVLVVPRDVVLDLQRRYPVVTASLLAIVAASFRRLTDATADLVFLDLPRRVAKTLLEHPRDAAGLVDLGLSQEQLAHLVGGTRQSVNIALHGFERRGWLDVSGRQIVLRDAAALARFAGEDVSAG